MTEQAKETGEREAFQALRIRSHVAVLLSRTGRAWGVIALAVQVGVFYLVRLTIPDLSERIEKGELAAAIWLGLTSVTAGMLSAASMAL